MHMFQSSLPHGVAVYGWFPFSLIILACFFFSAFYIRYFWSRHERDHCSALMSTLGLFVTLLTSFLLPVDTFLVSYMKNSDGTFKDWATNSTRQGVEDSVLYVYYSLYGIILLFAFFLMPLVYFAYEEKDDNRNILSERLCTALKYTIVFVLFAAALLIVGVFIPFRELPPQGSTEWEKIKFLITDLYKNRAQDALALILNILTMIGMFSLVVYTGIGLSSFSVGLVRGSRVVEDEMVAINEEKRNTQAKISAIRAKQQKNQKLTSRDLRTLAELEEQEHLIERQDHYLEAAQNSIFQKFKPLFSLFYIISGILGILFGFLVWVSLLLTNIDKLLNSLGYHMGYALKERSLPNPVDYLMVEAQKVFPLDYLLFFAVVIFLILCTISGIRSIGIWCLCVRMYKIRPHRTQPQALIILCVILMYTVLALNILLFSIVPQYTMYGNQHYRMVNETTHTIELVLCNTDVSSDECTLTRASSLILRFIFKAWIFGVVYYWFTWAFLASVVLGFFIAIIRPKQSAIDGQYDRDDFEESDDDQLVTP